MSDARRAEEMGQYALRRTLDLQLQVYKISLHLLPRNRLNMLFPFIDAPLFPPITVLEHVWPRPGWRIHVLWPRLWWVVGFDLPCAKSSRGRSSYGIWEQSHDVGFFESVESHLHCECYLHRLVFVMLECVQSGVRANASASISKWLACFPEDPSKCILISDLFDIFVSLIPGQRIHEHHHEYDITRVGSCTRASIDSLILTMFFCLPCRTREGVSRQATREGS